MTDRRGSPGIVSAKACPKRVFRAPIAPTRLERFVLKLGGFFLRELRTMSESIHGHAVLHMMLDQDQAYTRASLTAAIVERYGSDARFHTCSAEGMDAAMLVDFLADKGKFVDSGNGFNTTPAHICTHDEH